MLFLTIWSTVVPIFGLIAAWPTLAAAVRRSGLLGPDGKLAPDVDPDRVNALLAAGPEAQAAIKRLIPFVTQADPDAVRAFTTHLIAERRASEEGREGLAAFLERRKARWVGEG